MDLIRRFAGPGIGFLAGVGLEVSGIEAFPMALILWGLAALWALIALVTLPPISRWLPTMAISWPAFESIWLWRKPPAAIAKTTQYQRGLVDFWRDGERAKRQFTKAIVEIGKTMEASNAKTAHYTAKFVAEQKRVPPSAERVYRRTTDLAQSLNRHTEKMAASTSEADRAAREMSDNYTAFLKWQTDKDALISSRQGFVTLHGVTPQLKKSMVKLRQTVMGLQAMNFAQSVNEACGRLIDVVSAIVTTAEDVRRFTTEALRIIDEEVGSRPVRRSASRRAKSRPQ